MADKRRLGRGLSALIPDFSETKEYEVERMSEIRVAEISNNPFQPRDTFDPESLNELKQSISQNGIIQPITVRHHGAGYQLISGERRLRAVRDLGFEKVPAFILTIEKDEEMLELALIENIQRENLNPIAVANAYDRLITECRLTQELVAQKVGKNRTSVTNLLRLLKLPAKIQESLQKGEITMGHARALLGIQDEKAIIDLWVRVVQKNLSVREVEALVRQGFDASGDIAKPKKKVKKSPLILDLEDKLRELLGTQVRVVPKKEGGKIEIDYYSNDDLDRVFRILSADESPY